MRLLVGLLLVACADAQQFEIRGTVVEGAIGIGGVTVTLYEFGHTPAEATTRTVFATTFTNSQGAFVFHPSRAGEYYVEVKKENYFAESYNGPTVDPADSTGDAVSIDADLPIRERKFSLMRLGELRGRIVDEDGKPVANLRVGIRPGTITPVVTDQDGYFIATKLRSGDYLVSVVRRGPEILAQFSEEDLKIVDQDLLVSNWPGVPLPVRSGASISVGTITARKTPYYRAHLSVQDADCAPAETWTFSALLEMGGFGPSVPCGKEFMVRNLAPGSYTLTLTTTGRFGDQRQFAVAPVEVKDRNLEVSMMMSSGADISGRMTTLDGAALPPSDRIRIDVTPASGPPIDIQYLSPDAAGKFLIHGLSEKRYRVSVNGLDGQYVKEIRFNSLVVIDGIITPIAGASGQLEIIIDDQAATIRGSVAGRANVASRIMVLAVKWPLPSDANSLQALLGPSPGVSADAQGRFQIGGLAPGEYRVVALTEDVAFRLTADTVSRIVSGAEKVTLERGGSQTVSLKIVEP